MPHLPMLFFLVDNHSHFLHGVKIGPLYDELNLFFGKVLPEKFCYPAGFIMDIGPHTLIKGEADIWIVILCPPVKCPVIPVVEAHVLLAIELEELVKAMSFKGELVSVLVEVVIWYDGVFHVPQDNYDFVVLSQWLLKEIFPKVCFYQLWSMFSKVLMPRYVSVMYSRKGTLFKMWMGFISLIQCMS